MMPTLRQLQYAVAVAEHRHFRRAAAACHVTQPALSAQVRQLEELLGVQIFERNRRQVRITAAGEEILQRARACLSEVRDLEELAARLARPGGGPLRIGVIPTLAPYLLPGLLPRLRVEHPAYELQLWEAQTSTLTAKLDEGELDMLLLALPLPDDPRAGLPLAREPFILLTPSAHPLATAAEVTENSLRGEAILLLEDGHCLRDHALSACRLPALGIADQVHANSLSMLVEMVRNGLGITLLPASAVPVELRQREGLAVRRFRAPEPSRMLGALWREGSPRSDEFDSLSELFAASFHSQVGNALEWT
jgi:LysR family hydrogen peroxide-inducible transcriptional activator